MSMLINGNAVVSAQAFNAQATAKHMSSLAVDGTYTAGAVVSMDEGFSNANGNRIICVYENGSGGLEAKVGQKDGNCCIVWDTNGTTIVATGTLPVVTLLDATHALVTYYTGTYLGAVVITLNANDTLTIGTPANNAIAIANIQTKCFLLDTNKCIALYKNNADNYPKAVVISVSGTTPSFGTAVSLKAAALATSSAISGCKIDTTHAFVTYDSGVLTYGQILTISGTTISTNTEASIAQSVTNSAYHSCDLLDSTHVIFAFNDTATSNYTYFSVVTISGTTVSSFGTKLQNNLNLSLRGSVVALSATKFSYCGGISNDRSFSYQGYSISGTTITGDTNNNNLTNYFGSYPQIVLCRKVDSTHVSCIVYDTTATVRRIYYQVFTISGVSTPIVNYMPVKLLTAPSNGQYEISLAIFTEISQYNNGQYHRIYIGGNESTNQILRMANSAPSNATDGAFGRGVLKLANSPIIVPYGQSLYYASENMNVLYTPSITVSGVKRLTA